MTHLDKIAHWQSTTFPQRLLLSGFGASWDLAVSIAAGLQNTSEKEIRAGIHADTLLLKDEGLSFKVGAEHQPTRDTARGLIEWINQTPVSERRLVILEHIERASNTALQALLKVLEEPPARAQFIITTRNHHQLLPTIISRVTTLAVPHNFDDFPISAEIKDFLESPNLLLKFSQIEVLREAQKTDKASKPMHAFADQLLLHARFFPQYQNHLEAIFEARQNLDRNLNPKLVLESLAINLTPH